MAKLGGLLLAGIALFLLTRAAVLRRRAGRRKIGLTPVEVAYLVGGPEHALLVAALALHDAGGLRPTSRPEGVRLTREQVARLAPFGCVVTPATTPEQPVERAIVRVLAAEPGRPAANQRLLTAPEMTELHERLTGHGLIVDSRMTQMIRLSALWPFVIVGLGLPAVDADRGAPATWIAVAAAAAVTIAGARFGVPRQTPAARRAIEQAAAHRRDVADRLTRRLASVGFGTDDPELRRAGVDPMVVAAHGPVVLWSADPMLAVALGSSAPTPARHGLLHVHGPLHSSPSVDYGVLSDGGFP